MAEKTWTNWPEKTGQQFIHHSGNTWVGVVNAASKSIPDGGLKLTIWKGGSYYTVWSDHYTGNFYFLQIQWPDPPQ